MSKYWQSFGELNNTTANQAAANDEFREELPFEADDKGLLEAKTPRRDFLKYLGFSTAAAAVAASCEMPVKKAIPFVNKPDNVIPGVANYYATTYVQDGDAISVVAKVRDGRPIKIEGNDLSPVTMGGTSARVQASVLDLYDTARLRYPMANGKEVSTFEALDKMVADDMAGLGAGAVVLLTSTINSPSTLQVISQFLAKYPGSRHVQYDAVSYSGMLQANELCYGKRAIPSYHFDNAKVVVSLAADFLGTWVSPVEFAKQYAKGRKITDKTGNVMGCRHIQFESIMSMTGANADIRHHHRPSHTGAVALALYAALGGNVTAPALDAKLKAGVEAAAKELKNSGAGLVVSGSNDVNVQIIVNAINELLGAGGKTISWAATNNTRKGIDADMVKLIADMNSGAVGAVLVHGANPAYNWQDSKQFVDALKKVKLSVSFNQKLDETAQHCKYVIPDHHFLESWGDAEAKTGYYSLMQPTIYPLFKTRQWQDSLLKWSGATTDYLGFLKGFWSAKVGDVSGWDAALRDGVINPATAPTPVGAAFSAANVATAAAAINGAKAAGKVEVFVYEKVSLGAGEQANNPWLQELPDPITKATWDNYATISPKTAKDMFGIDLSNNGDTDAYEVHPEKQVVKITANGKSLELPIIIVPGTNPDTIGVALGYGRGANNDADEAAIKSAQDHIGRAGGAAGKNAFPWVSVAGGTRTYSADATVEKANKKFAVAQNQTHQTYDGRTEVVLETTLATLKKEPKLFKHKREHLVEDYAPKTGDYEKEGTLYGVFDKPGIKWGMNIDLNTCTGCGACVVACNAENNVSVVGKVEVTRGHEMHWLRIDRYFSGDLENPNVIFQPMLCQHCDNAPCENVCPVAATNHSSEGLNQMTYNRCIGTRYCANNCPYKVRRFNWADYTGADSFADNQVGHISEATAMMNDDLTRMVLNPDVTVRSRGVIEKCSFCVQRLQASKLAAKKESRPMQDSDIKVACQQACPSDAIQFGNVNDKESNITTTRKENDGRLFYALEMIHVLPNVSYLAKVRNTDELIAAEGHGGAEQKEEHAGTH
jgi:molybdopterin-containing oxidoreductase family iron-sulfur binding subunit